jgi:hypothetical protein
MPLVSWGFLGVWAGGRASPAQTLIGPDRRMVRGGIEPPTSRFAVARFLEPEKQAFGRREPGLLPFIQRGISNRGLRAHTCLREGEPRGRRLT